MVAGLFFANFGEGNFRLLKFGEGGASEASAGWELLILDWLPVPESEPGTEFEPPEVPEAAGSAANLEPMAFSGTDSTKKVLPWELTHCLTTGTVLDGPPSIK